MVSVMLVLAVVVLALALALLIARWRRSGPPEELRPQLEALDRAQERTERALRADLGSQREELAQTVRDFADVVSGRMVELGRTQQVQLDGFGKQLMALREELGRHSGLARQEQTGQLRHLMELHAGQAESLRTTVDQRLQQLTADNGARLDQMRQVVDEKLQGTLEQRLGESFRMVSERLEQVHKGLGEMQVLATGVGDLKRVLTNVKARGGWGEVQLEALISEVLAPEQFERNIAPRPGFPERVEFAVRLPGGQGQGPDRDAPVWLPIDAKFPLEDWQRLQDAQDPATLDAAGKALEVRIKACARDVRDKYVHPPHTTDFAIIFLPVEGLYAEVARRPALLDVLQRDFRVLVAGPTTLAALLNSLQMGFRTLAIQQRSSEVWQLLGAVKAEFGKFGDTLDGVKRKLEEALRKIEDTATRSRAIERKMRAVEALPLPQAQVLLAVETEQGDRGAEA